MSFLVKLQATIQYRQLKIFEKTSIGAIIKKSEMLRFVLDHRKTKKMCTNTAKKLSFVIRYNPD